MENSNAPKLAREFFLLQEERVETYSLFEEGYAAYLKGAPNYNFPMYQQLVHEITETFKKISEKIIDIERQLNTNYPLVAKCIREVQQEEKRKLELTVQLQLAKQRVIDEPDLSANHQNAADNLKKQLQDIVTRISEQLEDLRYEAEDLLSTG